jgi:hypothetical protein
MPPVTKRSRPAGHSDAKVSVGGPLEEDIRTSRTGSYSRRFYRGLTGEVISSPEGKSLDAWEPLAEEYA